jgi:Tol biopolymer transport system component
MVAVFAVGLLGVGAASVAAASTALAGRLLVVQNSGSVSARLMSMAPDGSDVIDLTPVGITPNDPTARWSPDGTQIAFDGQGVGCVNTCVAAMQSDGSAAHFVVGSINGDLPAWSPDGTRLVFSSFDSGYGAYVLYEVAADGSGLHQLTNTNGHLGGAAVADWSPDGLKIAYGNKVINADGTGAPSTITSNGGSVRWSHDGTRFVFVVPGAAVNGNPTTQIAISDLSGNVTVVTHDDAQVQNPAWSPDDTHLVFQTTRDTADPSTCPDCVYSLYTVATDGSDLQIVSNETISNTNPNWDADWTAGIVASPMIPDPPLAVTARPEDGGAYVAWSPAPSDGGSPITGFTVTATPGGETAQAGPFDFGTNVGGLTNGVAYQFTVSPTNAIGSGSSSPPSNVVVPASVPGPPLIVAVTPGPFQAQVVWASPASDGGNAITGYTITVSPGGRQVAISPNATETAITGLTAGTSYTFTVSASNGIGTGPASSSSDPVTPTVWFGSGRLLMVQNINSVPRVVSLNPDGSDVLDLTPAGMSPNDWAPRWSPDATQIAFTGIMPGHPQSIVVMRQDGSGAHEISGTVGGYLPVWSPDGTRLAFTAVDPATGGNVLYEVGADGTNMHRLTNADGYYGSVGQPDWSPDGSKIAYFAGSAIYTINADGTGVPTKIVFNNGGGTVRWSHDGTRLAYVLPTDAGSQVAITDLSGNITTVTHDNATARNPEWSPDDTHLVFQTTRDTTDPTTCPSDQNGNLCTYSLYTIATDGTGLQAVPVQMVTSSNPNWDADWTAANFRGTMTDSSGAAIGGVDLSLAEPNSVTGAFRPTSAASPVTFMSAVSLSAATPSPPTVTSAANGDFLVAAPPGVYDLGLAGHLGTTSQFSVHDPSFVVPNLLDAVWQLPTLTLTAHVTDSFGHAIPGATVTVPCSTSTSITLPTAAVANGTVCGSGITASNGTAVVTLLPFAATSVGVTPPAGLAVTAASFPIAATTASTTAAFALPGSVPVVPSAPTNVAAVPGDSQASVSWKVPATNGGSPITGYVVTPYIGTVAQTSLAKPVGPSVLSVSLTGLTDGTVYTFRVVAKNLVGSSPAAVSPPITVGAPVAPVVTVAVPGSAAVTVSWHAPAPNGTSAVTGYVVTPYVGTVAQTSLVKSFGVATTETLTGLVNGTTYTFRVSAKNLAGLGPQSAASVPIVVGAPTSPTAPSAGPGNGQALVRWTAPATNNGSAITGYVITPYTGTTKQTSTTFSSTTTTETVTGLTNGTTYTFTVAAKNARGIGPSATTSAVTIGPPVANAGADATVNSGAQFVLDASGSSDPNHQPLTFHWDQIGGPLAVIDDPSKSRPQVTAPKGAATLTFRVTVTNSGGTASSTDSVVITVKAPK